MLLAALVAGLAGSGHCLAMCGGIAAGLARAGRAGSSGSFIAAALNSAGRLLSYALAGALVATATRVLGLLVYADQLRTVVAWTTGLALVMVGLNMAGAKRLRTLDRAASGAWRLLAPLTRTLARVPPKVRPLAAGMLWGWLPCGMAYAMLLLAAASADPAHGALLMLAFGLGTAPALVTAGGFAGAGAAGPLRPRARVTAGVALACFGIVSLAVASWPDGKTHSPHVHARASLPD